MTLHQMKMGAKLDFKQCLQMEYRMALHFMADHDFHEGVRAGWFKSFGQIFLNLASLSNSFSADS